MIPMINLGNSVASFSESDFLKIRFHVLFEKAMSSVCFFDGLVLHHSSQSTICVGNLPRRKPIRPGKTDIHYR